MGQSLPNILTHIATLVVAGLLLFAVFGHARAETRGRTALAPLVAEAVAAIA